RTINLHIIPSLGAMPVQKLTPARLERFYSDKVTAGCGRRSVELCHMRLSQALDQAVKLGIVARSVAEAVTPPRVEQKQMQIWTREQTRQFLTVASQSVY